MLFGIRSGTLRGDHGHQGARANRIANGADRTSCAQRAVFAQAGFRRATVEEIARRAEVAKGTIYLYFDTKEAILADLVLEALAELQAQFIAASDGRPLLHPDDKLVPWPTPTWPSRSAPDYYRLLTAFDGGQVAANISAERGS